ncbi:MAG: Hsp20/alpha crystallin family protein [Verrucomicrobia bacterium]|nr:MAG: Hsp20/alpha crystallin family protein [Verrucomicrobiota bacterium]
MAIVPWSRKEDRSLAERGSDPFNYLRHQVNRVFEDFWGEPWLARGGEMVAGFAPQVDVTETDKEIKVCAEIPGVDAKDVDVTVEDDMLTIKGEKKYEREENEKGQYRMERSYGSFERSIPLPVEVDDAKAKAEFKNGVLRLTLPKRPGAKSRRKKIPVK